MSFSGITADTGFLVGVERSKQRALLPLKIAIARRLPISVPVAVLAEWWRGGPRQAKILKAFEVEAMTESLTALIEPIMIAVIGVLVGGMIVALYMPIFDIYSHISGS